MIRRTLVLAYGLASYALFLASSLYAVGFIGGFVTPTSLDGPRQGPLATALAVDLGLLCLFAVQHSGMARPAFKRRWMRVVPEKAERSTYVLLSSLALIALFALWRPIGGVVWSTQDLAARIFLYGAFAVGWALVLTSTYMINHFDLFGLRQAWLYFRGRPYTALNFATPVLYRHVRHSLYVGWLLASWVTPQMTVSHMVFAVALTAYVLIAVRWEERDLLEAHPEYAVYRQRVPMLIPRLRPAPAETVTGSTTG
jgi:protein-S-isoprenylcysteine O-methyltransferase Ste14